MTKICTMNCGPALGDTRTEEQRRAECDDCVTERRVRYTCAKCGGTDVGHDATSAWDEQKQAWVLGHTFDDEWCSDCGETHLVEQEI
jgi:hypothetical protein